MIRLLAFGSVLALAFLAPSGASAQLPQYHQSGLLEGVNVAFEGNIPPPFFFGLGYDLAEVTDLNLDGHLDLLLVSPVISEVIVFRGEGDGSFIPQAPVLKSAPSLSVLAADFNEDGRPDIVCCNGQEGTICLFRSNPLGGGYLPEIQYATGSNPVRAYADDLDEDSHLDLVVVDEIDSTVGLLRGNGNGTLQPPQTSFIEVDDSLDSLTISDLDLDGHKDLVIPCPLMDLVAVLRGVGNGSFLPVQVYPVEHNPGQLSVADHDGDGHRDVIVPNRNSNSISWLKGDGTGHLAPAQQVAVIASPNETHSYRSAPGLKSCVAIPELQANQIRILSEIGNGQSPEEGILVAALPPKHVLSGDFNEDGFEDLVVISEFFSLYEVFLQVPLTGEFFLRGDVNGDGSLAVSDAIGVLEIVLETGDLACGDRADVNDDGQINIADPIHFFGWLFAGSASLAVPQVECGPDPTADDLLDCTAICTP